MSDVSNVQLEGSVNSRNILLRGVCAWIHQPVLTLQYLSLAPVAPIETFFWCQITTRKHCLIIHIWVRFQSSLCCLVPLEGIMSFSFSQAFISESVACSSRRRVQRENLMSLNWARIRIKVQDCTWVIYNNWLWKIYSYLDSIYSGALIKENWLLLLNPFHV